LRTLFPQFAEQDRNGFMQQDAEEFWGQIIHALNEKVSGFDSDFNVNTSVKFVDQFMTTEFLQE
jgi:ubiquitin carboxyl-terminal hydrolase 14